MRTMDLPGKFAATYRPRKSPIEGCQSRPVDDIDWSHSRRVNSSKIKNKSGRILTEQNHF